MNHHLCHLLKREIRASLVLARNYRLAGERRAAIQFMNDAANIRQELAGLLNAID
ncbi:hypothetical protein MD588_19015 [Photobacterium sp. SDRW27]|uniref:hypothetical protein n=1 Tax=Photobacterium obscurum TaxID=2829490 RepID=UPI002243DDB6|nr:hypothetical protein [Photobacterium obscurum]MCW8330888.1 hypothetical protein [Photobacterium obscurum]